MIIVDGKHGQRNTYETLTETEKKNLHFVVTNSNGDEIYYTKDLYLEIMK